MTPPTPTDHRDQGQHQQRTITCRPEGRYPPRSRSEARRTLGCMDQSRIIGETLPTIRGESLSRDAYVFPDDLEARATLFLVAFRQRQQTDVNTWLGPAGELAAAHTGFAYYEVPLIGRRYRPVRAFIDGGMRSGIPDPQVRATTVTAYQSVSEFLRPLGIDSTDEIVALLVDRGGVIRWAALGALRDQATGDRLRALVLALTDPA